MNYRQKRTLVGRIVYIALTLMAVSVLCVSMYTFLGSSNRNDGKKPPTVITDKLPDTSKEEKPPKDTERDEDVDLPAPEDPLNKDPEQMTPTDTPPEKDWLSIKIMMPVEGLVYKKHDLQSAVYSATMNDYRIHCGIDIECNAGDDVLSCAYGTVKAVGKDPFMGNCVIIDHGDGLVSYYKNLADEIPENIAVGKVVYAGEKIGNIGESAIIEISDEAHLHFELELDGKSIDPLSMLDYSESASVGEADK